jgi:DNA replication protein DnaC
MVSTAMTTDANVCPLCEGTGWVEECRCLSVGPDSKAPRRMTRCVCWLRKHATYAQGVPAEFREARLENYRPMPGNRSALRAAKACLEGNRDLYLVGPTGSGKTRLACSVLNEFARDGRFIRVPKLLLDLQLLMTDGKSADDRLHERRYCEQLFSVKLLVLDDVGVEKPSQYTNRTLYTLYEERGDRGVRTIWTSNLGLARDPRFAPDDPRQSETLGEFLGDDRLPSRIAGRAEIAFLKCPDQRLIARRSA